MQDAFFRPGEIIANDIDSILRGAASQLANEIDNQVVDDVRNFLFGPPGSGGFDLASLNIQRGRDHGLADYNQVREDYGLERVTDFSQITSDPELAQALEDLYGSVDNIDVWVGGLAEDHVRGGSMGELWTTVISDQFERIRDGDRLWYENVFSGRQLDQINNTTLSDVIKRNTGVTGLADNAFFLNGQDPGRDRNGPRDPRTFTQNADNNDRNPEARTRRRRVAASNAIAGLAVAESEVANDLAANDLETTVRNQRRLDRARTNSSAIDDAFGELEVEPFG